MSSKKPNTAASCSRSVPAARMRSRSATSGAMAAARIGSSASTSAAPPRVKGRKNAPARTPQETA